jgi:methylphosphotriester-DNA--protein-cysteine methyltransferase
MECSRVWFNNKIRVKVGRKCIHFQIIFVILVLHPCMRYQKFKPDPILAPFIECYFIWEGEAQERLEVQSPPNCFCAIVFNYGDPTWAYQNSTEILPVPDAFICGLFTSNYHRILKGKIGMAGIVFKATAVHSFFGIRMSSLVNSRMPLDLLLGTEAERLSAAIRACSSDEGRVQILETFVSDHLEEAKKKISMMDDVVEFIDAHKGCVSVEEVASKFKVSRRYLEKQFLEKVGVSPKFYARIKRFGTLSNKVAHAEKIDWQDVVFETDLHDQSHLVKEYMEFNKMNPSEYHSKHREMTRFLKD